MLDSSGARSSGGSLTLVSAGGQPGGITESAGGGYLHQAGFLQTFLLKPGLDTDGDGVADEADRDNDGDGLGDAAEIGGTAFVPATATEVNQRDSDDDGASDGEESVAGTNPRDADALFSIAGLRNTEGVRSVSWIARSNKTYTIRYAATPAGAVTNVLDTVTATGSAPAPWQVTTQTVTDASADPLRVYAIEVQP